MYVIIIGAGEVGNYLAEILVEEGHDVAVVELDSKIAGALDNTLDALVVQGSGLNRSTLEKAGIRKADLVLAVTEVDEVNLVACMTAHKTGKNPMTVARVRDIQYIDDDSVLNAEELGLSHLVSPEQSVATEVLNLLAYDGSGDIHYLADGRVALLELPVSDDSPLANETLADLADVLPDNSLIAAISDEQGLRIPSGSDTVGVSARAHVLTIPDNIDEFWILSGKPWHHVSHVLIIGCGEIGYHLARELERQNFRPTIIEIDQERAEWLSHKLQRSTILLGDGTDPAFLREQLDERADAVVCLLEDDEKSMLVGLFAKHLGAKKVIVRNDKPAYAPIGHKMGIDALLSPKTAVAHAILRFVRRGTVASAHMLGNHEAEILEIEIAEKAPTRLTEKTLSELDIPDCALIGAIIRGDEVVVPKGTTRLKPNDHLLVIGRPQDAASITKFFT